MTTVAREARLESFIQSLVRATARCCLGASAEPVAGKISSALRSPGPAFQPEAQSLPVSAFLAQASATARSHSPELAVLLDDFREFEPRLRWAHRPCGGPFASPNWPGGHANATIVGREGLEWREDVQIGVSLLAPHVRYPDHRHAPEEVYLVLSPGRFKNEATPWTEPGVGGLFHNPPGVTHAMESGEAPLLAIWQLCSDPP